MEAAPKKKKVHMGRRRLVGLGLGVGTLAGGAFVLVDPAWVGAQLQPFMGSALGAGNTTMAGLTPYGSLSYIVYAIGFGLVMSGIGLMRSIYRSSVSSFVSGGGPGAMGINPDAINEMMNKSMAQMSSFSATAAAPKETVKVKCRNCGSLEAEDSAFCHKCGQAI